MCLLLAGTSIMFSFTMKNNLEKTNAPIKTAKKTAGKNAWVH